MSSRRKPRKTRYLLTAVALSTGTLLSGCGSAQDEGPSGDETTDGVEGEVLPMPANPKGAVYDEGTAAEPEPETPPESEADPAPEPEGAADAEDEPPEPDRPPTERPEPVPPRPLPLPANPKGAHYDDGPFAPTPRPAPSEKA